jgi:hypothetical protein
VQARHTVARRPCADRTSAQDWQEARRAGGPTHRPPSSLPVVVFSPSRPVCLPLVFPCLRPCVPCAVPPERLSGSQWPLAFRCTETETDTQRNICVCLCAIVWGASFPCLSSCGRARGACVKLRATQPSRGEQHTPDRTHATHDTRHTHKQA